MGNTPTCVGKTLQEQCSLLGIQKHPHVRGEDQAHSRDHQGSQETPPRAWGRRRLFRKAMEREGNTPTCVGKTASLSWGTPDLRKHPHVRGEDFRWTTLCESPPETPPRAWGRLHRADKRAVNQRNTPTCVGKTRR